VAENDKAILSSAIGNSAAALRCALITLAEAIYLDQAKEQYDV
jgi:hypothetical protein